MKKTNKLIANSRHQLKKQVSVHKLMGQQELKMLSTPKKSNGREQASRKRSRNPN